MTTKTKPTNQKPLSKRKMGSPLLPAGSAGAVTRWYPTRWPRIGGVHIVPLADDAFTKPAFVEAYEPGRLVFVYCAGCGEDHRNPEQATGLLGLSRRLCAALHKVSVTAQVKLRDRLRELNADRYGALTTSADGFCCSDLGYDNWMLQHILAHGAPLAGSPVAMGNRCLTVRLPASLSVREFDKQLHARMTNAALNPWLKSVAGRAHCQLLGIAPRELARGTAYGFGELKRSSDGEEFYFFRPKSRDADRLLRLAEAIIHDHVVLPQTTPTLAWKSRAQGFGTMTFRI
ncbi:hypothetical protein [Bosea sp. MMO-172]|uniref:hypothetical protein n=1 Tax=Bosea sp. MMO-172 TaxID=3127885 RepID=UPI003016B64D